MGIAIKEKSTFRSHIWETAFLRVES